MPCTHSHLFNTILAYVLAANAQSKSHMPLENRMCVRSCVPWPSTAAARLSVYSVDMSGSPTGTMLVMDDDALR